MTDRDFISEILANPDDDSPRLIYADWLEEHGDPLKTDVIRTQCELAKFSRHDPRFREIYNREHALLAKYEPIWAKRLPAWTSYLRIRLHRGFGGIVFTTIPYFLKNAVRLAKSYPIRHAFFSTGEPYLERFVLSRHICNLRTIEIDYCQFDAQSYRLLADCSQLRPLTGLRLVREANLNMAAVELLMRSVNLRNLKVLSCPNANPEVEDFLRNTFPKWSAP